MTEHMQPEITQADARPVAWAWEGRDSSGFWEERVTLFCPHLGQPNDYCRYVRPLYIRTTSAAPLVEALEHIKRLRPAGDVATATNTRALVQQMEMIADAALAQFRGEVG